MTEKCIRMFLLAMICLWATSSHASLLDQPNQIKENLARGKISAKEIPNPHWKRDACKACHRSAPFTRANIRTFKSDVLCGNCHNPWSKASFNHPTGMSIPKNMYRRMPEVFFESVKTLGGDLTRKMNCLTCHDLVMQCLESRKEEKFSNPLFLRTGPFRDRVQLCFYCHKAKNYNRYNPHEQIKNGKIVKNTCSLCHKNVKNLNSDTATKDIRLRSEKDINKLCTNCHPWRPHPGWEMAITQKKPTNHLVKPSRAMKARMMKMKNEMGIDLPLGPKTGKVTCSTCHNPHQKGVIKSATHKTGPGNPRKLRIIKSCSFCHEI